MDTSSKLFEELQAKTSSTTAQAFATDTWNNIRRHWSTYVKFCKYLSIALETATLVNFLQLFSESVGFYNTVVNVFSSIKTMSKIMGFMPSDSVLFGIKLFLSGLKSQLRHIC